MKKFLFMAVVILASCKNYIEPVFINENKKDGIIELVYSLQSAPFEYVINPERELKIAKEKCASLGYVNAIPIGKQIRKCAGEYCKTKELKNSYKCL